MELAILVWKIGLIICCLVGMCAAVGYLGYALFKTVRHYAWYRAFKFIYETPYSRDLDVYVSSDDRQSPILDLVAHLQFYGYFPNAFLVSGAISLFFSAVGFIWPVGIPVLIVVVICEVAYRLNGQNRLAATLKDEMPETS